MAAGPRRVRGTALITGASAGIGAEFARVFAEHGHDVVLVARRQDALEGLAGQIEGKHRIRATVLPADLSDLAAPAELFEAVLGADLQVDILVNNAGFGLAGEFAETDLDRELAMIQVNVAALTHLTKLFVRPMIQRRSGGILNVASVAALFPGPLRSVYYASKAYVLSFTEALAEELRDSGVRVTALCPGPTATEFHAVSGGAAERFGLSRVSDARSVARFGYESLQDGVRVAIPGFQNKLAVQARRLAPRGVVTRLVRQVQEKRQRPAE
ncbi:MAG TPA: SDR family oxidoreductase [Gemmatimonadaceae bacterium]|nr:SDR family oxidoreductase [Gemmatimonadaceae bacterium]